MNELIYSAPQLTLPCPATLQREEALIALGHGRSYLLISTKDVPAKGVRVNRTPDDSFLLLGDGLQAQFEDVDHALTAAENWVAGLLTTEQVLSGAFNLMRDRVPERSIGRSEA